MSHEPTFRERALARVLADAEDELSTVRAELDQTQAALTYFRALYIDLLGRCGNVHPGKHDVNTGQFERDLRGDKDSPRSWMEAAS